MTWRAVILGGLLAAAISSLTYFNDEVIRQTYLIGNHLPASVFGAGLILLLAVNPLLGLMSRRWQLGGGEIALVVAMGLAVCAWPGSNLLRIFSTLVFEPTRDSRVKSSWRATEALAYTPGVSPRLAGGYIKDWPRLIGELEPGSKQERSPALERIDRRLRPSLKARLNRLARHGPTKPRQSDRRRILRGLNRIIEDPTFYAKTAFDEAALDSHARRLLAKRDEGGLSPPQVARVNRALLDQALPGVFKPAPKGEGVLLANGHPSPRVADPLVVGRSSQQVVGPAQVPWSAWWPTLRLWLGLALAVGLAAACMMLIVHRQWAEHERLPYPIVQFLGELTRTERGRLLPDITRDRLFWIGLGLVGVIHLSNGLHAWFDAWVTIPLHFDFSALGKIMPNVRQTTGSHWLFHPAIYPAVIGFGFFITSRVSASLGLSLFAWVGVGAYMISSGLSLSDGRFEIGANGTALRFGAYFALTVMILYFGRRFYWRVILETFGLGKLTDRLATKARQRRTKQGPQRASETETRPQPGPGPGPEPDVEKDQALSRPPRYAGWAGRGLILAVAVGVYLLVRYASLDWPWALMLIGIVLMTLLVLARINVETGLFYAQPGFIPAVLLAGLFGTQGLGPQTLIVLLLASTVLLIDPRTALTPFIANALRMTERIGRIPPRRSLWPLGACIVGGLVLATLVTLTIQYNLGLNHRDGWASGLPIWAYNRFAQTLTNLDALGQLQRVTGGGFAEHMALAQPETTMILWTVLGLGLTLACSVGRIRFAWWPIHPVLFVVWGTYPANHLAISFLIAAAIKEAVLRTGGVRAFTRLKPLMVGLIAADILAVIGWSLVGASYYLWTGLPPETYRIFPG